ncbi:MAG: sulfatase-like hydrolase/transferase [Candidatus Omnitrophica bacterium]|nr:sulfatase-like hydrolase/transferase [Candidatus Omnitrophota bacterium]
MRKMKRRNFMSSVGLGAAGIFSSSQLNTSAAKSAAVKHPNILLIITDQQHAGMMSCAGNPYLKTPAMDRLASQGVRFDRAYCGNPVCMPSRFCMMTGVLPSRIGMEKNGQANVPPGILSHAMGNVFRSQGYETVYGGKVHLPGDQSKGVTAYGFDSLSNDEREDLANACRNFFQQSHDKPFLMVASFINPHDICYMAIDAYTKANSKPPMFPNSSRERECLAEALQLPAGMSREEFFKSVCPPLPDNFEIPPNESKAVRDSDWRDFRRYVQEHWSEEKWRMHRWAYTRLTERVDSHIGVVLDSLYESGLDENTVVVFTSDHGDMDAAHRLEHKSMPYDEATRVPLIICQPGVADEGRVDRENLVSTGLDLMPTLCHFAGIEIPKALPGHSVKPLTSSSSVDQPWRKTLVVENERSRILISNRYKYAVYDHGDSREMLIDLEKDPGEMKNLAVDSDFTETLHNHRRLLKDWYQHYGEVLEERFIVV